MNLSSEKAFTGTCGITMAAAGIIANSNTDLSAHFTSTATGFAVIYDTAIRLTEN